jgi:hypothetical protein
MSRERHARDRDAEVAMSDAFARKAGALARAMVDDDTSDHEVGAALIDLLMSMGACPYYHAHTEVEGWIVALEREWRAMMPSRDVPDPRVSRSWLHRLGFEDVLRAVGITTAASDRRGDDFAAARYWYGVCSGIERER